MWWMAAIWVASLVLIATSMQPKVEDAKPAALGDFSVPEAEEGGVIPVLFGTRIMRAPNVIWWGHLKVIAIVKKGGKK